MGEEQRTNWDVTREFWTWVCAHPVRLGRLVGYVCWTLGCIVAAVDIFSAVLAS